MFKDAKILVAGGTGFIGVNLIRRLLSLGSKVRATLHNRPAVIQDDAIEYVQADLTRMDDCRRAAEGVDYVFMCAANTSGAAVMANTPLAHVTSNVVMNAQSRFIEVQGTAEGQPFDRSRLDALLDLAAGGIEQLVTLQAQVLRSSTMNA